MKKLFQYFLLPAAAVIIATGCFQNYYKATRAGAQTTTARATTLDSLTLKNKDFILRSGTDAFYMSNLKLSNDQKSLFCRLDSLSETHMLHLTNGRGHKMRYRKEEDEEVLTEVHLYLSNDNKIQPGDYTVKLDNLQKIEIIEKDRARTVSNHVLSTVGVSLVAAVIVVAIIVATSSCPYVSTYDGNKFVLQGEAYSGAIYPQLARDDYMPLQMRPSANGRLQIKISNELQEKQNTDLAELLVITHNKNTAIAAGGDGTLYEIAAPETPIAAICSNQKNAMPELQEPNDGRVLYFDDTAAANARNHVIIQFNKPAAARKAKLVLSLKNSFWLDYLYGEMTRGLGTYYNTYIQQQSKKPAAELTKWIKNQQMPLEVSVKTDTGWKKISDIGILGPAITRKMVVPIDLSGIHENFTSIQLSSGFMFWEIDYAAIDYSAEPPLTPIALSPLAATDENGSNVAARLTKADGIYLEQPHAGNTTMVDYAYEPLTDPDKINSYILHTKGYYTHNRNFTNKPDINFLQQFKKPGALPAFSLALYKKFRDETFNTLSKK